MSTQLQSLVGPANSAAPVSIRSILRVLKARVKNQQLTCDFTEQRTDEAPPRTFTLTAQELVHLDLLTCLA